MLIKLLRAFGKTTSSANDTKTYCYRHTGKLAAAAGLKRSQPHASLVQRLTAIVKYGLDNLEAFKVQKDTYTWFRKEDRGPVPADELGPYRFFPKWPAQWTGLEGRNAT